MLNSKQFSFRRGACLPALRSLAHRVDGGGVRRAITRGVQAAALGVAIAVFAPAAWASGTAQLKAFVSQVHAARGDFVQREVKAPAKNAAASGGAVVPTLGGT